VEEFERLVNSGKRLESRNQMREAISNYEAAHSLYQGNFLEENSYDGWTALPREHLRMAYLDALDHLSQIYYNQESYAMCISLCQRILIQDPCREDSHCMLMRCYNHMGQDHLALRQYQACLNALRAELDVAPAPDTTQLFEQIRQHKRT
jgi:DNA-binding SARP family transcriptional activator